MSVTFGCERRTDGTFLVHLTDGGGTGTEVVVSPAMLLEIRQVLDLLIMGASEYAEVGPFTEGQARSWVP